MSITAFKCPCCGAELTYSSQSGKMTCDYCGTEIEAEAAAALAEEHSSESMEWDAYNETNADIGGDICTYTCNSCGAQIAGDRSLGAAFCPYCGSPFVITDRFDGILKPDHIIPFKVDKETAVGKFKEFCKKRPLLPGDFISSHQIESVEGMYVPYWLFDCKAEACCTYRAQRSHSWSQGDYIMTKTDHYMIIREGSMDFEHVPVDGTSKLGGEITEAVEPFDLHSAQPFNPAFLSGYLADRYDVSAEESRTRANQRIRESVRDALRGTVSGYTSVIEQSVSMNSRHGKVSYSLMPMWLMTAKYRDKLYTFAINGQTSRFIGELPVSAGRCVLVFLLSAALSSVLIFLILSMLGI